jgi:uncharacterized membrane protein YfcA
MNLLLWGIAFIYLVLMSYDGYKNKGDLKDNRGVIRFLTLGFITDFGDALGIGSFAPSTAYLKLKNDVTMKNMPGTLNVGHALPVIMQAIIFMGIVDVELKTLVLLIASACLGAWLGPFFVAKTNEKQMKKIVGLALLASGILLVVRQVGWIASLGDGTIIGLNGPMLILSMMVFIGLGALQTGAGIGLYAPAMAYIYSIGMNPAVAFPIMMGASAFMMPIGNIKAIKEGVFDRKVAMLIAIGGVPGVIIASIFFSSLNVDLLAWLVIGIVFLTAIIMIKEVLNDK